MKRIIAYTTAVVMLTLCLTSVQAQDRLQLKLGWNSGMPLGEFKDFLGKNSFRGFHGELMYPVKDRLRVGLGVAFNDYYEKHPRQLYHTSDGTISAVVTNSIQTIPLMAKVNYDLTGSAIRPYVGLGAGINMIGYSQYLGEFGERNNYFKPVVGADAGVNIPFNKQTRTSGINLGAHFNFMPFNKHDIKSLNNWGVHAGVFFPLR